MDQKGFNHFIGGALGGTVATAVTMPFDVVKTRLQSSKHEFEELLKKSKSISHIMLSKSSTFQEVHNFQTRNFQRPPLKGVLKNQGIVKCFLEMIRTEGPKSLYKGLLPTIVAVAPTRAFYFYTYSSVKRLCNQLDFFVPNTLTVHMVSGASAGILTSTLYNPIGIVKTRLQLSHEPMTVRQVIARTYKNDGIRGFFKGLSACYLGVSELIIHFALYEHLRSIINEYHLNNEHKKLFSYTLAGGFSKFVAVLITYPHEVVRTRLREEGTNAKGLWKTLATIYGENGMKSLYRGLTVQLLRSVPNTGITFGVYEAVVFILHKYVE